MYNIQHTCVSVLLNKNSFPTNYFRRNAMFQRILSAVLLFASLVLTGCAGQNFYLAARDPQNPASYVFLSGRVPGGQQAQAVICVKEGGDTVQISCGGGSQLNQRNRGGEKSFVCLNGGQEVGMNKVILVGRIHQGVCPAGIYGESGQQNQGDNSRYEVFAENGQCPSGYKPAPWVPGTRLTCWRE